MIPRLAELNPVQTLYMDFIDTLRHQGFEGDLNPDYANRVVLATDNSIYQILPQGVLYPKKVTDLEKIARLADQARFHSIVLSARGGGTGTNGQSLTDGLIVDCSKYMNRILEINPHERWVRVQAGVVKDQLNAALKPYGLFFAPELSTSNRATIGGMINTDASGQGSVLYGKTRDHVLELDSIWLGGERWLSGALSEERLAEIKQQPDRIGEIHRELDDLFQQNQALIASSFPKLNRCLTGYDLAHIRDESGRFNLNSILCGAEGSLAFIAEAKLNVLPIPKYAALVNVKYTSFESSLRDAKSLMDWQPTSIETIDSKVLNLAMGDIVWDTVRAYFPQRDDEPAIRGINLIEYTGDDEAELKQKVDALCQHLASVSGEAGKSFGYSVVYGATEINKVWAMRKKAVGLLGNAEGPKRPVPFVEDTAVPPENLADFIMDFRRVLDEHELEYGMFGHVDAGVLHVRPALDMKDPEQEVMIRRITDEVVRLTQQYKGLLWGEHGKGIRSEYAPEFFGALYPELQRIKALFDPRNQMNPGKIATPSTQPGAELLKIDAVPTRGQQDRQIPVEVRDTYESAMNCNGNGACYNYDPNDAMCPSWKGTRQRIHSPKGRSSLIREWLRLLSQQGSDLNQEADRIRSASVFSGLTTRVRNTFRRNRGEYDFSNEVHEAMMGCLACKSCVAQCPIKVNVPDFRARFLEVYYGRYLRPMKDYLVGSLEFMIPTLSRFPAPYNWAMRNTFMRAVMKSLVGMVDSPVICRHGLRQGLRERSIDWATEASILALTPAQRDRSVVIVQDAFTSYFETQLVLDLVDLLSLLGFNVLVAPFMPNGKPLHVHGFMQAFNKAAEKNLTLLRTLDATGLPLVGIDPSMTLTYRSEYKDVSDDLPNVMLIQEWLVEAIQQRPLTGSVPQHSFKLLAHCTEKTSAAPSIRQWQTLFGYLGQELEVLSTGCCGMSGTFGHEAQNYKLSKEIYALSWSEIVNSPAYKGQLLATGYSCRSQVKRLDNQALLHPVQALLSVVQKL
ncbi:FAD-binding and (Fe-S)-binding domain-containing protein [Nitrincola sp.]|uniref:D-2-hydroxyglutarate dehydrogenase YdiJ n=1 Tax=Nitrincola sp. TaxID=1926584 RepID=UPI003A90D6DE